MIIGLAMQSCLAWTLGPEIRGEYAICLIFSTFSAIFFTFGLDWAASYYTASKKDLLNQSFTFCISYLLLISALMWPTLNFIIQLPIKFFEHAPQEALTQSILWAISILAFNICSGFLRGSKMFTVLAIVSLSKALLLLLITLMLVYSLDDKIMAPIWADIFSNISAVITMVVMLSLKKQLRLQLPNATVASEFLHYGSRMFFGSLGMMTNLRIGTVLIAFYLSKVEIGYFALAMALLTQIGTLADAINNVTVARIAESHDGRHHLITSCSRYVSTAVLIAGITLILSSEWLIPLLFSSSFYPAIAIIAALFPGMWLRSLSKVLFSYFNGTNKPQLVSISMIVNILSNIILMVIFVPLWGLSGAAWAVTVANTISAAYSIYWYFKLTNDGKYENIFFVTKNDIEKLRLNAE